MAKLTGLIPRRLFSGGYSVIGSSKKGEDMKRNTTEAIELLKKLGTRCTMYKQDTLRVKAILSEFIRLDLANTQEEEDTHVK